MGASSADEDATALPQVVARPPVIICFPFAGGLVGGSHISAVKLIQSLDPRQFTPLVLLHREEGPVVDLLHDNGVAYELAPVASHLMAGKGSRLGNLAELPGLTWRLARFLRRRRVDIVHTNDGAMHATWALPARLAGARLLWHHRGNPDAAGLRYLAPLLASRVVAVSRYAAPRPGPVSAAGRCSVVHSPFEPAHGDVAEPPSRAKLGLAEDTRILGYFGNLTARKRPLVFVEVIARVVAQNSALPVVGLMFGDVLDPGLDAVVLARAAELGIADRIRLMGFLTPPEPWLALCDLLVVTAIEEPFGRTLIEAMMLGTPVVAAASGGNIEAIRHLETGVLVDPDNPSAFATAILAMIDEPLAAARIAAAAREEALDRFSVASHVDAITSIYRQLAA